MKIVGKVYSYNKQTNIDCFGLGGPNTIDHIWPTSKGGSNTAENTQKLSVKSNGEKSDKTSGKINGIRFSITEIGRLDTGKRIGKMHIMIRDSWYEVIPTK